MNEDLIEELKSIKIFQDKSLSETIRTILDDYNFYYKNYTDKMYFDSIRSDDVLFNDLKLISELEGEEISFIIKTILKDYVDYYLWKNKNNSNDD